MIEDFVRKIVNNMMNIDFDHAKRPGVMFARITRCTIYNEYHSYNLKILDKNLNDDDSYPEIPGIKSKDVFKQGDNVMVLLPYGRIDYLTIIKEL